jgi:hypothetical protein
MAAATLRQVLGRNTEHDESNGEESRLGSEPSMSANACFEQLTETDAVMG